MTDHVEVKISRSGYDLEIEHGKYAYDDITLNIDIHDVLYIHMWDDFIKDIQLIRDTFIRGDKDD